MEYECKMVSLSRLVVTDKGALKTPLCDSCFSSDCSNKLAKKDVSIFGVISRHRVIRKGTELFFVVSCKGYIASED